VKASTYLGFASSLVIVLVAAACATGTENQTGDNQLVDPGDDGGQQQGIDDSEAGMLSDEGGSQVQGKKDSGSQESQDASSQQGTDAGTGTDSGTGVDSGPPKPDAGCVVTTQNLLTNGNLDTGKSPWVLSAADVFAATADLPTGITPQSGGTTSWLGGADNANDSFYQAVAIPANATAAHLKGYKWIGTEDIAGSDHLSIQTRSSAGSKLEELVNLSPGKSDGKWIAFDYTLSNVHAGQTIQIAFIGTTDSSLNTNFWVDSLDLEVTYCKY